MNRRDNVVKSFMKAIYHDYDELAMASVSDIEALEEATKQLNNRHNPVEAKAIEDRSGEIAFADDEPQEAKAEAGLHNAIYEEIGAGATHALVDRILMIVGGYNHATHRNQTEGLARPVDAAPSLESAAWDMLHAVEAADAAGELAENIGGELIDALRAALTSVVPPRPAPVATEGLRLLAALKVWLERSVPDVPHLDWETGYRCARGEVRDMVDAALRRGEGDGP